MTEYHFSYDPHIRAGRVVFRVNNVGRVQHRLGLYPLDDDLPPIDAQLHGTNRRAVNQLVQGVMLDPGRSNSFAVDLIPNKRYAMICFVESSDGSTHALHGMNSEFHT